MYDVHLQIRLFTNWYWSTFWLCHIISIIGSVRIGVGRDVWMERVSEAGMEQVSEAGRQGGKD